MPDQTEDVNTESESSTDSTFTSENVEDVKQQDPSSSEEQTQQADLAKGFQDAIKEGFEAATSNESSSTIDKKREDGKVETKVEDKGPIPYERFVEVNSAKQKLEQELAAQKDYVAAQKSIGDFCIRNNITNEDFSYWLNVAAAIKNNPEQAKKLLEPHFKELQAFEGDVLSPELQAAVDNGEISIEWAKKIAASENQKKFTQNQARLTQEQLQQQSQQRFMQEVQTSFQNWAKTKATTDPDFQPKKNGEEDGKFEFVLHKMSAEYPSANIKTVQDLIAFADKVYESVNKSFGKFVPQRNGTKNVRSNQSTSTVRGEPKTLEEAIALGARKAGVNFSPSK